MTEDHARFLGGADRLRRRARARDAHRRAPAARGSEVDLRAAARGRGCRPERFAAALVADLLPEVLAGQPFAYARRSSTGSSGSSSRTTRRTGTPSTRCRLRRRRARARCTRSTRRTAPSRCAGGSPRCARPPPCGASASRLCCAPVSCACERPRIDLADPASFANGQPHDAFRWLREHDPVHWHAEPDGGPGFFARHALRGRAQRRTRSRQRSRRCPTILIADPQPGMNFEIDGHQMMLMMDPPKHTQYRRLISSEFTPRGARELGAARARARRDDRRPGDRARRVRSRRGHRGRAARRT